MVERFLAGTGVGEDAEGERKNRSDEGDDHPLLEHGLRLEQARGLLRINQTVERQMLCQFIAATIDPTDTRREMPLIARSSCRVR